jgi:large subunit ribosomal protein L13
MMNKTFQTKKKDIKRRWHLIDADSKVLGRLASEVAQLLMGKHKKNFVNHLDVGDYVVVINAGKIELTGRKRKQKVYRSHSGYPGGFKEVKFEKLINEQPQKVIEHAVSGMLPKNRLKKPRMRRLKVFEGKNHSYKDRFK